MSQVNYLRPVANSRQDSKPEDIGVVICTYTEKRLEVLLEAIDSLKLQTLKPSSVVVVVDHNPGLFKRLRSMLEGVLILENAGERGLSGSRNTGVQAIQAAIIGFLDDDAIPGEKWLATAMAHFRNPEVVAVGGSARPNWVCPRPRWFPDEFGWVVGCSYVGQPESLSGVRNLLGSNMAVRRDVFEKVGGFSEALGRVGARPRGCEETEFFIRVNQTLGPGRVIYDPQMWVSHMVGPERAKLGYFLRRCFFEGRSKADVARLVGTSDATASEREYSLHVLPRSVLDNALRSILDGDPARLARSLAIVSGLFTTLWGYIVGSTFDRNNGFPRPSTRGKTHLAPKVSVLGNEVGQAELRGQPMVSVVVPSIMERRTQMERCLDSLCRQDYPDYEVLVIDNRPVASELGWSFLLEEGKTPIRVIRQPFPGISSARNLGVAQARGSIIAFTDDDVVVGEKWLTSIVARMKADKDISCVTGPVLPAELATPAQRWFEEYFGGLHNLGEARRYRSGAGSRTLAGLLSVGMRVSCETESGECVDELSLYRAVVRCGSGANMAFRREALEHLGGFDPALGTGTPTCGGEDLAIFAALFLSGGQVFYDPSCSVHHFHRQRYGQLVGQVRGFGTGLTAMLTALVLQDPTHLVGVAEGIPKALSALRSRGSRQGNGLARGSSFVQLPPWLRLQELLGMLRGPAALLSSRRMVKRHASGVAPLAYALPDCPC
jgi:cellulose synthase/poly-beta-1,6-N-acetylglucosamine synthase-like glycosyltransferase